MSLRVRLLLGFIPVFVALLGNTWLTRSSLHDLTENSQLRVRSQEVLAKIQLVEKLMVDMETGERGFLLTGDDDFLEPYSSAVRTLEGTIAELERLLGNDTTRRDALAEVDALANRWLTEAGAPAIALRRRMDRGEIPMDEVVALVESRTGKDIIDPLRARLADFARVENQLGSDLLDEFKRLNTVGNWISNLGMVLAATLAIIAMAITMHGVVRSVGGEPDAIAAIAEEVSRGNLGVRIANAHPTGILLSVQTMVTSLGESAAKIRRIAEGDLTVEVIPASASDELGMALSEMLRSLRGIVEQTRAIARGVYTTEFPLRSSRDELGQGLIEMTHALRSADENSRTREWMKTGLAGLALEMQGIQSMQDLARQVIGYLAAYLQAQMGSLYLWRETQGHLALAGSYAFNKRKALNETIRLGEGIAGQAGLEKQALSVVNVPEDYVRVSSALGDALPRNIVAAPFLFENRLVGVVELACLREFSDRELAFLASAMESMGIAFNTANNRQQLADLLDASQQQAMKLKLQAEELEQQQQELKASNEELEQQSEELRVSNEELEEKTLALERQQAEVHQRNQEIEVAKQAVEEQARELEQASRYKSEFLANMSHELRTPLNSMLILAKLLSGNPDGNLSEEQVESARVIYSGGQELLALINEILDLSKVEAGMMEINPEVVPIDGLSRRIQEQFDAVARDKGLEFIIRTPEGVFPTLRTDRQRLEQILRNLLSNAFKFTAQGTVTLAIEGPVPDAQLPAGYDRRQPAIAFSVSDTGPGIPGEKLQAVFEAFQQVDGSTSRKYGGTGLGLSISRALAQLLQGEIQVRSTVGEGSTFTLYLPLAITQAPEPAPKPAARTTPRPPIRPNAVLATPIVPDDRERIQGHARIVLIVEDDPVFTRVLMDHSRKKGFQCLAASSGGDALELALHYRPSAIILDLGLPDMDGVTVLEKLKEDLVTRHIPVHVISARTKDYDVLGKGAMGYFTKPITPADIDRALASIEALLCDTVKNVLVVEDDVNCRKAIEALVSNGKVKITGAGSGAEAEALLLREQFHCIILDLGLPDISGVDLLCRLEEVPGLTIPPVIVYTGKELSREEIRQLAPYSTNVIVKCANSPERLLDETSLFLHTVAANLPPEQENVLRMLHDHEKLLKDRVILVVDDDLRNSFALSKVLENAGMRVVMAENGQAALGVLENDGSIELVLMDIMMPVMDGYETMARIRDQKRFAKLPIIALTAKAMPDDQARCIEAGASDYLAKPIDTDRLISLLRVLLYR